MDREYKKKLDLLVRSLDQDLLPTEALELQDALKKSIKLQEEKTHLLEIRGQLQAWQPATAEHFATRVMRQIGWQREEDLGAIIVRLFPRVAAACVLVLGIALGAIYLTEGSLMMETIIGVSDVMPEDALMFVENGF
ncbi:MAG: hypothetical protein R2828_12865 [Saprospiraceae bacterium]